MKRNTDALRDGIENLADDARVLLKATADVAEKEVVEARERLTAALDEARGVCSRLQKQTIAKAKAADQVIRSHPYETGGFAFGLGLLIGFLVSRRI